MATRPACLITWGSHPGHTSRQQSRDCERREDHSPTRGGRWGCQRVAPQAKVNRKALKSDGEPLLPAGHAQSPPPPRAQAASLPSASTTPDPRGRGPCYAPLHPGEGVSFKCWNLLRSKDGGITQIWGHDMRKKITESVRRSSYTEAEAGKAEPPPATPAWRVSVIYYLLCPSLPTPPGLTRSAEPSN